jgi:polyferredoxin
MEELGLDFDTEELYRDQIATVDKSGKRIWIYPKKPKGRFYEYRKYVSYVLLLILFGMPFIKVNDKPFMLFNIPETEFILFGIYFAPQDFHLFVIAMLIGMVFIVLFTVIYGRLFCGWVCPQTIFMEMVFRRIEYWIEGDANAQRRLAKAPWTASKAVKKIGKQAIFILISAFIAHTFLSYIIGLDEVVKIVREPISEHWKGFTAMVIFTTVFYGVFSVMREQVCTTICPYGRLQGVLLDENSLAVAYDFERGEPRGKLTRAKKAKKSACKDGCSSCKEGGAVCPTDQLKAQLDEIAPPPKGDCIDCGLCVQVCPTGIDIRNGTQLECINCTACMDACDEVMIKIKKPTGLVRIDSYNGIVEKKKSLWNTRVAAYTAVLVALLGLESFLFINRSSVETLFLRTPGMLFQTTEDGYISNLYNYQLINKSDQEVEVSFTSDDVLGIKFEVIGNPPKTLKNQVTEGAVFIKIPKESLEGRKTDLTIQVFGGGELLDEAETTFLGPGK